MKSGRLGTASGKWFNYLDPDPNTIDIEDIAQGLSHVCRFSGQLEVHYSVAQHSINVALKVWEKTKNPLKALQGLLHDASEAYMGDCPKPLKDVLGPEWTDIENDVQDAVYEKYGVPPEMYPEVHEADKRWVITEKLLFQPSGPVWNCTQKPYHDAAHLSANLPPTSKSQFLFWFYLFTKAMKDRSLYNPHINLTQESTNP